MRDQILKTGSKGLLQIPLKYLVEHKRQFKSEEKAGKAKEVATDVKQKEEEHLLKKRKAV